MKKPEAACKVGMFEIEDAPGDVMMVRAVGRLTAEDYRDLAPRLEARFDTHEKVNLVVEADDVRGMTPGALWEDAKMARDLRHYGRVAVVGDKRWIRMMTPMARPFLPDGVRHFPSSERDAARAWAAGETVSPPMRGAL